MRSGSLLAAPPTESQKPHWQAKHLPAWTALDRCVGHGLSRTTGYCVRRMPPIPAHLLGAVVFHHPDRTAAESGQGYGGSGFLASVPLWGDAPGARYIVTNQHVAVHAKVARLTNHTGGTEIFDTPRAGWRDHPDGDDVSVFPIDVGPHAWRFPAVGWGTFAHIEAQVVPGDDIFFVGRFIDPKGEQLQAPTARFGHLAMRGTTKVWQKQRQIYQESFVVEALSLAGYSGSPVLAFRLQLETPFMGGIRLSVGEPRDRTLQGQQGQPGEPVLLGIDWGHIYDKADVLDGEGNTVDGLYVNQNRGMAGRGPRLEDHGTAARRGA
jgi:hypothetical protein